uniref:Uncharacterized protein n=1 Tax=Rhizophora mucronata TaxID=61149 RepID=A0A2P2L3H9_RHIMU
MNRNSNLEIRIQLETACHQQSSTHLFSPTAHPLSFFVLSVCVSRPVSLSVWPTKG